MTTTSSVKIPRVPSARPTTSRADMADHDDVEDVAAVGVAESSLPRSLFGGKRQVVSAPPPAKKAKLSDVRDRISSLLDEKRSAAARHFAVNEEAVAAAAAEHGARMQEMAAAAHHMAAVRALEITEKQLDVDIKKQMLKERCVEIEIKQAQLRLLQQQLQQ
jgi:hypothetical protein